MLEVLAASLEEARKLIATYRARLRTLEKLDAPEDQWLHTIGRRQLEPTAGRMRHLLRQFVECESERFELHRRFEDLQYTDRIMGQSWERKPEACREHGADRIETWRQLEPLESRRDLLHQAIKELGALQLYAREKMRLCPCCGWQLRAPPNTHWCVISGKNVSWSGNESAEQLARATSWYCAVTWTHVELPLQCATAVVEP